MTDAGEHVAASLLAAAIVLLALRSITFVSLACGRERSRRGTPAPADQQEISTPSPRWLFLICTAGTTDLLVRCLRSVLEATSAVTGQVVIACDHQDPAEVAAHLTIVNEQFIHDRHRVAFVPTGLLSSALSGKARAINSVLRIQGEVGGLPRLAPRVPSEADVVWRADVLVCVDVDECLTEQGVLRLWRGLHTHPDSAIVQATKHDRPCTRSMFGRALSAQNRSWFHWEAGVEIAPGLLASSYYGSMAAIRLPSGVDERWSSRVEFSPDYEVEDFPFFVDRLHGRNVVLLDEVAGVGDAPRGFRRLPCDVAPVERWEHTAWLELT